LFALGAPAALAQALPARPVPAGMSAPQTGTTGRVLTTRLEGSSSATKLLQAVRLGLREYFDGAGPRVLNAARDRADRRVQASFTATVGRAPVYGLIAVTVQGPAARAVVLFDRPSNLARSIERLVSVAGGAVGGGAAQPAPAPLTRTGFPDGSGSIGLARGWRVTNSYKGTVDLAGPSGAGMSLGGYQLVVPAAAAAMFPGSPPVTSQDPVQATVDVNRYNAQRAGQSLEIRVLDRRDTPWQNGRAAFVRYSAVVAGQKYDGFGLFALMPVDTNQMLWYCSYVIAPSAAFPAVLPDALRMWGTWSINPAVFTERLMAAARSMRETGDIVTGAYWDRQASQDSLNAGWSEYFRGLATLEDPQGNRGQTDLMFASEVVKADPVNWRIVPASELGR
jgi:hypothetical protein